MPDAPPAVVLMQQAPADYALPSGWEERARGFRVLTWRNGLVLSEGECPPGEDGEIVVCAARDDGTQRIGPEAPQPPTAMEEIGDKLNFKVGPAEVGTVSGPDWVGVGVRIRF